MLDSDKIRVLKLSNGHASTLSVLVKLQNKDPLLLKIIEDLKFSQPYLWNLYKNICKMDIDETVTTLYLLNSDDHYLDEINDKMKQFVL